MGLAYKHCDISTTSLQYFCVLPGEQITCNKTRKNERTPVWHLGHMILGNSAALGGWPRSWSLKKHAFRLRTCLQKDLTVVLKTTPIKWSLWLISEQKPELEVAEENCEDLNAPGNSLSQHLRKNFSCSYLLNHHHTAKWCGRDMGKQDRIRITASQQFHLFNILGIDGCFLCVHINRL